MKNAQTKIAKATNHVRFRRYILWLFVNIV